MKNRFKNYKKEYLINDIISGIVVALISIPISMGYAQVAGLPVVYGLYGSLFPVLIFGLLSTSPQFVFGVDAAPAALAGGTLAALGVVSGSDEALRVVPVITFMVAVWLLILSLIKAGKLVNYISKPVLGGFISGIAGTIILMQVSKLFGGASGTGEIVELVAHIVTQLPQFNLLSFVMGDCKALLIIRCLCLEKIGNIYILKWSNSTTLENCSYLNIKDSEIKYKTKKHFSYGKNL